MPDPEEPTGKTIGKADDAPRVTTPEYVRVDTGMPYIIALVVVSEPVGLEVSNEGKLEDGEVESEGGGDNEGASVSGSIDAVPNATGDVRPETTTGITYIVVGVDEAVD